MTLKFEEELLNMVDDFAVRFLYRAAAAASNERVSTVREVGRMLDISGTTVQDILINYGDI